MLADSQIASYVEPLQGQFARTQCQEIFYCAAIPGILDFAVGE
ncbi:hypothetical protein RintRC_1522 [Richelia intracellularis]|nr:hypothetical protein RintRC_1522 [Richelia intracellularis]